MPTPVSYSQGKGKSDTYQEALVEAGNAPFREEYNDIIAFLLDGPFDETALLADLQHLEALLTPHLAADPNSKGAAGSFEKLAQYVPVRTASMRSQLPAAPLPPTPREPDQIHVGDLDGSAVAGPQRTWTATVTVTIHDYVHGANVAGANVAGSWSGGVDGDTGCVTDAAGQCSLTAVVSKKNLKKITFTVDGVSALDSTYIAGFNHDVDVDSDGNSIAVSRP